MSKIPEFKIEEAVREIACAVYVETNKVLQFEDHVTRAEVTEEVLEALVRHYGRRLEPKERGR